MIDSHNLTCCYPRFAPPPSFLQWPPVALSHFCRGSNAGLDGAVTPLTHSITDTWRTGWELHTLPGFPNLMANKGDIHLAVSEIVMATLSLLSLVYVDARQPFSLHSPLIPPSPGPFITGSLGRWDRLTVGVNGDVHSLLLARERPLWIGVQGPASEEFVTGMDILIGPLTFRKTLPGILMSWFFSAYTKLKSAASRTTPTTAS